MSDNIYKGAVVQLGKGKVLYTVLSNVVTGKADIESQNTGKAQTVDASRLVLVKAAELTDAQVEELDETYADHGMVATQEKKAVFAGEFVPDDAETIGQYRKMAVKVLRKSQKPLKLRKGKRGGKLRVA